MTREVNSQSPSQQFSLVEAEAILYLDWLERINANPGHDDSKTNQRQFYLGLAGFLGKLSSLSTDPVMTEHSALLSALHADLSQKLRSLGDLSDFIEF